jgi:hypothetical protein
LKVRYNLDLSAEFTTQTYGKLIIDRLANSSRNLLNEQYSYSTDFVGIEETNLSLFLLVAATAVWGTDFLGIYGRKAVHTIHKL